jgi:hypothetical protein
MKVLNLCCSQGHGFEGWFRSADDFQQQQVAGLIACPLCADAAVTRLPSAPRLNLSGAKAPQQTSPASAPALPAAQPPAAAAAVMHGNMPEALQHRLQDLWTQTVREVIKHTEDVGTRFPEEARKIHYGEAAARGIRGEASAQERAELADEGIEIMPLPMPLSLKGKAH